MFDTLDITKITPPELGYDYDIDVGFVLDAKFDGLQNIVEE